MVEMKMKERFALAKQKGQTWQKDLSDHSVDNIMASCMTAYKKDLQEYSFVFDRLEFMQFVIGWRAGLQNNNTSIIPEVSLFAEISKIKHNHVQLQAIMYRDKGVPIHRKS